LLICIYILSDNIELTDVEKQLLEYWIEFEKEHGKSPSIYRALEDLHRKGYSATKYALNNLVDKGLMEKKQVKGRMGNVYSVKSGIND